VAGCTVPMTFGNDGYALEALETGVALVDQSHWGRLRVAGPDRLSFLQGQSTADVASLTPGQGTWSAFTNPQGRCIDLVTMYVQQEGVLIVTSPGMGTQLTERLNKYIFPADKVQVADVSSRTSMFVVLGPKAESLMVEIKADLGGEASEHSHTVMGFQGKPVIVARGGDSCDGARLTGYTLIVDESVAGELWGLLSNKGAVPMGSRAWEIARVIAGRPMPGAELTDDFTPLDAGLYDAISLSKGCYVGQETLSKVYSRQAMRWELWGVELQSPVQVGSPISFTGAEHREEAGQAPVRAQGKVTSYVDTVQMKCRALAYLRRPRRSEEGNIEERLAGGNSAWQSSLNGQGMEVIVDGTVVGRAVPLSFIRRGFREGKAPDLLPRKARDGSDDAAHDRQDQATRKAEKLATLQAQLAAWQASQGEQQSS
jgi:folate-binding protein YgfZ